jgi:hypothetical protein
MWGVRTAEVHYEIGSGVIGFNCCNYSHTLSKTIFMVQSILIPGTYYWKCFGTPVIISN